MSPAPRRRAASRWLIGVAMLAAASPAGAVTDDATAASAAAEQLVLTIIYNGQPSSDPVVVDRQAAIVWMAASDLRALGVAVSSNQPRIALSSIPGLTFAIDDSLQTLTITSQPSKQRLHMVAPPADIGTPMTPVGWGGMVNYDMSATYRAHRIAVGGLVDAVIYGPGGYAYAGAIVSTDRDGATRRIQRLDTGVMLTDPAALRRLTIGDFITRPKSSTRPVRLIGVQLTTDFSLNPELVTFPVPAIDAQAAVPSAVDLIVNGSRQAAGDVKAGAFSVAEVPVQTGLNTISVAVRDALGRERLQTISTYSSTSLLAPGLNAYAIEGGFVRTGYATRFDRYGDFVASAGWRRGITGGLTLEGHVEGSKDMINGGVGYVASLDRFGLVSMNLAGSRGPAGAGRQFMISWERIARPFSVSGRYTVNSAGWSDLASQNGSITRSHTLILNLSVDAGRFGSLSSSLIDLGSGRVSIGSGAGDRPVGTPRTVDASSLAVVSYSTRIARRFSVIASGGGDVRRAQSFFLSAGLSITMGSRTSGYAGVLARDGGADGRADITRSALVPGDIGYRASIGVGNIDRMAGGVEYIGTSGRYALEAERTNGAIAMRGSMQGSLIVTDGGVFATDRMTGSFAVVDTNRQPNIAIFRDNRPVGKSNKRGKLLITNLRPYETTRIAFDPAELPLDASTGDSDMTVKPPENAGVRVDFGIFRDSAMTLHLAIPPGTRVTIDDRDDVPVGFDGEVYLPVTRDVNRLVAHLPDGGVCGASFARPQNYTVGSPPAEIACLSLPIATTRR